MSITIKDPYQIEEEALAILRDNTKITQVSNGTIARAILKAVNQELNEYYQVLTINLANAYLGTASGAALDRFGFMLNTPRGGTALGNRSAAQKFYVSSGDFGSLPGIEVLGGIIPAGTIIQTPDGSIQYRVTANIAFNPTDTQVTGSIEALNSGSSYNVGVNILTSHNLAITGILTTNIESIENGTDTQNDEEYRYVLSKTVTAAEAANETSILLAALSTEGVSDIRIVRYFHGVGTFMVLVIGTTPVVSETTLANVRTNVNKVTAAGEFGTIRGPRYIGLEVIAHLHFRSSTIETDKDIIVNDVENTIYDYINNIPVGQGFIRNELIQRIMDISNQILDVEDSPESEDRLAVYIWTPTTIDISDAGIIATNRIRDPLVRNYEAYQDDKLIVEQNLQGYVHETSFTPVTITYE